MGYGGEGCLCVLAASALTGAAMGQGLIVHAMTGQPVVGGLPGEVYTGFNMESPPQINNGHIVVRAYTNVSAFPMNSPLVVGQVGSGSVAFRFTGETGVPGLSFASTEFAMTQHTTRIAADGTFGLIARVEGSGVTTSNDEALLVGGAHGLHVVAREGSQAPGDTPGSVMRGWGVSNAWFESVREWSLSDTGLVALTTPVSRASTPNYASHTGVFTNVTGELDLVVRGNHGIFGNGTMVEGWSVHMLDGFARISAGGTVAVAGIFDSPSTQSGGIIVQREGELRRHVSIQEVPGSPGIRLNRLHTNGYSTIGLNDDGLFSTGVSLVNASNQIVGSAIVRASSDALGLVARTGDPKPGFPGEFFSIAELENTKTIVSGGGLVAFPDASRRGVYVGTSIDDLSLVFGPNTTIWPGGLGSPLVIPRTIGMNASDQMVAAFTFQGSTTRAIAGWDPVHGHVLLAYTGQNVEIEPGVFRTIAQLSINGYQLDPYLQTSSSGGGEDGLTNSIDSTGRVVFLARFTNNQSAVLVATIPAPAGGVMAGLGLLIGARRRR